MGPRLEAWREAGAWALVGLGTWLPVTAVFAEAPFMSGKVPEGDTLFALLDALVMAGNAAPALLVLGAGSLAARHPRFLSGVVLCAGAASVALLTLCWDASLLGCSFWLLAACLVAGAAGASSMCTVFPAAAQRGVGAVSALSAGVGSCGVFTELLGIAQGNLAHSTTLLFPVRAFFAVVLLVELASLGALAWIVARFPASERSSAAERLLAGDDEDPPGSPADDDGEGGLRGRIRRLRGLLWPVAALLASIFVSCFLEYAVPGQLPFLLPPKDRTRQGKFVLTLAYLTTSVFGRLLAGRVSAPLRSRPALLIVTAAQAVVFTYILSVAHVGGSRPEALPSPGISACMLVASSLLHGYIVTAVFAAAAPFSVEGTQWCGLMNQAGALAGAVFTLALVKGGVLHE